MAIDMQASDFLASFRAEFMRLSGKTFDEAQKAAFDWIANHDDWRRTKATAAVAMALQPAA